MIASELHDFKLHDKLGRIAYLLTEHGKPLLHSFLFMELMLIHGVDRRSTAGYKILSNPFLWPCALYHSHFFVVKDLNDDSEIIMNILDQQFGQATVDSYRCL